MGMISIVVPDSMLAHRSGMTRLLPSRQPGKLLHHELIDRALERHDQLREVFHRLPGPADEFRLVAAAAGVGDVDLAVLAGEAQREPFLPLAAVTAFPGTA